MSHASTLPQSQDQGASRQLEQRLSMVGPKDTTRGFLLGAALDVIRTEAKVEAIKRCAEAAGRDHFTAFFSYPIATLLKLMYAAGHELQGLHGGFDGALEHLGLHVAPRFLESASGKMLLSLVGREPKRLLDSMPTAYKTAWDHGQCRLAWSGPKNGRLIYTNAVPVAYFVGSVKQILKAAQVEGQAVGSQQSLMECTVEFSWA